jgi:hypothetical protein
MDLKLESQEGILLATASGQVSVNETLEHCKNICDVAAERRVSRILFDCLGAKGELSDMERYEIGKTIAEYCLNRSMYLTVAHIGKPPTVTGFGAQVASNRGLIVLTFSERQAGLDWLNKFASRQPHR